MNTPDYQDISQENPERIARQEAERAAVRARNAEMKNALKARSEARRPAIEAAKAERQAIADRNLAMQKDLPLGSVISGLTQSMINQGASPEQRSAAVKELMAAHRAAPRDVRGNTDMSALVSLLGKYTTQDQMNAALAERGRTGRFNAFDTYKTGLADFNQRAAADVAADQKARADIERSFRTQWGHAVRPQPAQEAQMGYMPPPQVSYMPQPVTRQPFDPNAALQAFNKRAAELNASGKGLFNSGVSPDEFRMYQGVLRNLQLNPNSTPEQHADILNKSMAFLNQYSGATPQPIVNPNVPYRPTGPDAFYGDQTGLSMTRTAPAPITMPPPPIRTYYDPEKPVTQPPMMAAPGGSTGFDERTGTYTRPPNIFGMFGSPLGMRPQPQQFGSGFTVGGLLGRSMGMMQPQPVAPSAPPMAYKKGGAVKPVWDKKRPDDLGKPKSLSVKKKKAAKARAAAAGRPYPNLIDNMAAARKKGK